MDEHTRAETLQRWAEAEQGLAVTVERAGRLAKSLAPIRAAVDAATARLAFEAEPANFARIADRLRRQP